MNISINNNQNYFETQYKNIVDTLDKNEDKKTFVEQTEGIFEKARKYKERKEGLVISEVLAFNNMQNKMKLNHIYA